MKNARFHIDKGVSIYLRGRKWWLDVAREGGRKQTPLHTESQDHALTIAKEMAGEMVSGEWNIALAGVTTFDRAVERFQKEYESKYHCDGTRKFTARLFRRVGRYLRLRHRGPVVLDKVRRVDIEAYQSRRMKKQTHRGGLISPATVNRELRELGKLWSWVRSLGLTRSNPVQGVRPLKVIRRLRRTLTPEECMALVAELPEVLADIVRVILCSGLRFGEASHLQSQDIGLDQRRIEVRSRPEYLIKDREERAIDNLPDLAVEVLRRRKLAAGNPEGFIFTTSTGSVISNRNALRDIKLAAVRARLKDPDDANWQTLRRTFASFNAPSMGALALQVLLGHADPRTTAKYYIHGVKVTPRGVIG